jgi:hypothetical protein
VAVCELAIVVTGRARVASGFIDGRSLGARRGSRHSRQQFEGREVPVVGQWLPAAHGRDQPPASAHDPRSFEPHAETGQLLAQQAAVAAIVAAGLVEKAVHTAVPGSLTLEFVQEPTDPLRHGRETAEIARALPAGVAPGQPEIRPEPASALGSPRGDDSALGRKELGTRQDERRGLPQAFVGNRVKGLRTVHSGRSNVFHAARRIA